MNTLSHVPPGFRFHPTDEELVDYYLRRKVTSRRIDLDIIKDVDLYKIEPWDLQEGWVVCRVFKKRVTTTSMRKVSEHDSPCWYDDQVCFMQDLDSPRQITSKPNNLLYQIPYNNNNNNNNPCKKELDLPYHLSRDQFLQLPLLESPKLVQSSSTISASNPMATLLMQEEQQVQQQNFHAMYGNNNINVEQGGVDQVTDWRVLDKFVASQLSHDNASSSRDNNNNFHGTDINSNVHLEKQEMVPQNNASTSNSTCPIHLWK
ncbi:hypothetical protein TanjilG_17497 [Lupinus angustifolius]|uniref:NAC domain-containing protein n=1 Tax=Lupinus angustifolius TaxID=3871 RepID=A0A4P1R1M8_LUPAN|nr:hypothetical protein TanjilG_17497 [Lupinus angustifolius]